MTLLSHQFLVSTDDAAAFASQRTLTPLDDLRQGFAWFLFPVPMANRTQWLIVNAALGFVELIEGEDMPSAEAVEQAAFGAIEVAQPMGRDEHNVSVSFDPADVLWHEAQKMPVHVGASYQRVALELRQCRDFYEADIIVEKMNATPLMVNGYRIVPVEGIHGVLRELADAFADYDQTTPLWKKLWHRVTNNAAWLKP